MIDDGDKDIRRVASSQRRVLVNECLGLRKMECGEVYPFKWDEDMTVKNDFVREGVVGTIRVRDVHVLAGKRKAGMIEDTITLVLVTHSLSSSSRSYLNIGNLTAWIHKHPSNLTSEQLLKKSRYLLNDTKTSFFDLVPSSLSSPSTTTLNVLDNQHLMFVYGWMLMERSIIIIANDTSRLHCTMNEMRNMIFPFRWVYRTIVSIRKSSRSKWISLGAGIVMLGTTPSMYLESRSEFSEHFGDEEYFQDQESLQLRPPTLVIALDSESRAACVAMSESRLEPTSTHTKRANSNTSKTTIWIESRDRRGPIEFESSMCSVVPVPYLCSSSSSLFYLSSLEKKKKKKKKQSKEERILTSLYKSKNFRRVASLIMKDYLQFVRADRFVMKRKKSHERITGRDIMKRDSFASHLGDIFSDSQVSNSIWKAFVNTTMMDDFLVSLFLNKPKSMYVSCGFDLEILHQRVDDRDGDDDGDGDSNMSMFRELHLGERCTWLWRLELGSRILVQRRLNILEAASNELTRLLRWIGLSLSHASEKLISEFTDISATTSCEVIYPLQDFKSILDEDGVLVRVDEVAYALGLRVGDVLDVVVGDDTSRVESSSIDDTSSSSSSSSSSSCNRDKFMTSFRSYPKRPIRIRVIGKKKSRTMNMIKHVRSTFQIIHAMAKCVAKSYRNSVSRHAELVGWIRSRNYMQLKLATDFLDCMTLHQKSSNDIHRNLSNNIHQKSPNNTQKNDINDILTQVDNKIIATRYEYETKFLKSNVKSFLFDSTSSEMFDQTIGACACLQAVLCSYRQPIIISTQQQKEQQQQNSSPIQNNNNNNNSNNIKTLQRKLKHVMEFNKTVRTKLFNTKKSVNILRVASEALFECSARMYVASRSRDVVIVTAYWIESPNTSIIVTLSRSNTHDITEILRQSLHAVMPKHVPSRVSPSFQVYILSREEKKCKVKTLQSVKTCKYGDVLVLSPHDANFSESTTIFSADIHLRDALQSIERLDDDDDDDDTLHNIASLRRLFNNKIMSIEEMELDMLKSNDDTTKTTNYGILEKNIITLAKAFWTQAITYSETATRLENLTKKYSIETTTKLEDLSAKISQMLEFISQLSEKQTKRAESVRVAIETHCQCLEMSSEIDLIISANVSKDIRLRETKGSIFSRTNRHDRMLRLRNSFKGVPAGYVLLRLDDKIEICSERVELKKLNKILSTKKSKLVHFTFSDERSARAVTDLHDANLELQRVDEEVDHASKSLHEIVRSGFEITLDVEKSLVKIMRELEKTRRVNLFESSRVVEYETRDFITPEKYVKSLNVSYLNLASSVLCVCDELDSYLSKSDNELSSSDKISNSDDELPSSDKISNSDDELPSSDKISNSDDGLSSSDKMSKSDDELLNNDKTSKNDKMSKTDELAKSDDLSPISNSYEKINTKVKENNLNQLISALKHIADFMEDLENVTIRSKQALSLAEQNVRSKILRLKKKKNNNNNTNIALEYATRWISEYLSFHSRFLEKKEKKMLMKKNREHIEVRAIVSEIQERWNLLQDISEQSVSQCVNVDTDTLYSDRADAKALWISSRYRTKSSGERVDVPFSDEGKIRHVLEMAEIRMARFRSALLNITARKNCVLGPSLEAQRKLLFEFGSQRARNIWIKMMRKDLFTLKTFDQRLYNNSHLKSCLKTLLRMLLEEIEIPSFEKTSSIISSDDCNWILKDVRKWCHIVSDLIEVQEVIVSSMFYIVQEEESRHEITYLHQTNYVEFPMFKEITKEIHTYFSERDDFHTDEGFVRLRIYDKHEMYLKVLKGAMKDLKRSLKTLFGFSEAGIGSAMMFCEEYDRVIAIIKTDVLGSVEATLR